MQLDRPTPVEDSLQRRRIVRNLVLLAIVLVAAYYLIFSATYVMAYESDLEHFKYGSIGSEVTNGLPTLVFKALPKLYEEELGPRGYGRFGLLYEPGADLPIGFSRRVVGGIERVWLNCAVCHVGTVAPAAGAEPALMVGAPSNNLRLYDFIQFLRRVPTDSRFNPDNLIAAINSEEVGGDLGPIGRALYRYLVFPRVRDALLEVRERLAFLDRQKDWGPGRVDTFNPYKAIQFNFPMGPEHISDVELNGSSDYPAIWQQRPRQGLNLHWDGNNPSVDERNLSAALGAGVTPVTVDHASIRRIRGWMLDLEAPEYVATTGYPIDREAAARGRTLYAGYCSGCHGIGADRITAEPATRDVAAALAERRDADDAKYGAGQGTERRTTELRYDYNTQRHTRLGQVEALAEIGTDPGRWASYTEAFAGAQSLLFAGTPYRFRSFRKTRGYANQPLDGIWARSPYLHNGSVPTLRDLLEPAERRPEIWYRGDARFDPERVGYLSGALGEATDSLFQYDTRVLGNSNSGHEGRAYGTLLSPSEKDDLVEYMKTL